MKNAIIVFFSIALLYFQFGFSQTIDTPYTVGTWQGFRTAAISYTFDDNCPNQLGIAVPMFNEYGFKLTLFTTPTSSAGWAPNWTGLQNASAQGHEIASHTITHNNITGMKDSVQDVEFGNSQLEINTHIPGMQCVTLAYPFCETGNNSIVRKYYFAARICSNSIEGKTPGNFLAISSNICGTQGLNTVTALKARDNAAVTAKGWCVYLIHGINGNESGAWSPISADTIRASLEYLKANPDKFWVETFGNVAKYIRERNSVSIRETSQTDTSFAISVIDTMDNAIFNYPITIRRPLPSAWIAAEVKQGDRSVDVQIIEISSIKYIMFDAIPDSGDVAIKKSDITNVSKSDNLFPTRPNLFQNFPNPFNPSTTIKYELSFPAEVTLKVYNLFGQELETIASGYQKAGEYRYIWQPVNVASGIYFYQLQAGQFTDTRKLILLR